MKRTVKKFFVIFFGLNLAASLYAQASRLAPRNDSNAIAGPGQSEIIINTQGFDKDCAVWVNGNIAAHVPPNATEKIIVQNGSTIVELADTTQNRNGQWNLGTRRQVNFNSDTNRVTIGLTVRYGTLVGITIRNTVALGGASSPVAAAPPVARAQSSVEPTLSAVTPPSANPVTAVHHPATDGTAAFTLENSVYRAAQVMISNIPAGSTLAVLSISSNDSEVAEFVIEELAYYMVETRKFRVVDRRSLDAVRAEHHFQISGDVSDDSAISIGKMLGATIVITGSVSGSGATRRLRTKALDVQTAEIVSMASERY